MKQCELWISQAKDHSSKKKSVIVHYEAMKRHFATLKVELDKLSNEQLTMDGPSSQSPHLPPRPPRRPLPPVPPVPPVPPHSDVDSFTDEKSNVVFL